MMVGVIGGGVVGKATARSYLEHADEVRVYDLKPGNRTHTLAQVLRCDIIFLCLPTPQVPGELGLDVSAVDKFFADLPVTDKDLNFVLKSTVPVGTTKRLRQDYGLTNLVHSPEFLTARCAYTDSSLPSRNIIGGVWCDGAAALHDLYRLRWPETQVLFMGSDESEATKIFLNSFFAVKVAFFNEMYALADKLGLDWQKVLKGMLTDGRVTNYHTKVPGHDGLFGFGGTCLPKDLSEVINTLSRCKLGDHVTFAAMVRNRHDRERKVEADREV